MANLDEVYQAEVKAAGDNAAEKLRIDEAYEKAKLALKKKYNQAGSEADRNAQEKWNQDLLDWLNGDGTCSTGSMATGARHSPSRLRL